LEIDSERARRVEAVGGDESTRKVTKQPDSENQYESQLTADVQGNKTRTQS